MSIELRRIQADDWELLRDVRLRALADAPDAFGSTYEVTRRLGDEVWRERAAAHGNGPTLIALEADAGLAMGGVFTPDGPTAWVWGMWTDPSARGRGISGQVLDSLVAWVRDSGRAGRCFDDVRLHVTEGNHVARALYVGRGFAPTGVWEPLREGSALQIEELRLTV